MPISAKKWPLHHDRVNQVRKPRPAELLNSPVLYPFPQYLQLKVYKGRCLRFCLFCNHMEVATQRVFLRHAKSRLYKKLPSGNRRPFYCWERKDDAV